jgi:2-dehydropantoate 2-reductase
MGEILALARARGVDLTEEAITRNMGFIDRLQAGATASMQRDIIAGRPSELEYQNGTVVRLGRQAGVSTPVHAFLYASLLPQERRARGELEFSI